MTRSEFDANQSLARPRAVPSWAKPAPARATRPAPVLVRILRALRLA